MLDPKVLSKFKIEGPKGPVIFTGDECLIFIPKKYENYNALVIQNSVRTLGVFNMEVDGMLSGMCAAAFVDIIPTKSETVTIDNDMYAKLTLLKGDVFLKSLEVVRSPLTSFPVYVEYIKSGRLLNHVAYEELSFIFDRMMRTSGISFDVDHTIYELIFAHLCRDADDLMVPFCNTNMKGSFRQIPLTDVAHAATSTTSRVIGAYFNDGINASVNNHNDARSAIEDTLRQ